jgi:hypothetical protein
MADTKSNTNTGKVALPRAFRLIRLELAREAKYPTGNPAFGYRIVAPLDQDGRIDAGLWKQHRDACRVVRFRPDEDDEVGHLVHKGEAGWTFHYDIRGGDDDEAGYRFGDERFAVGEYVSIRDDDDELHTFKIMSVEHI